MGPGLGLTVMGHKVETVNIENSPILSENWQSTMTQDCSYKELYALQVLDDSMEPEFPEKCVIVIEPSDRCSNGAYVIVSVAGDRFFRQYIEDPANGKQLCALKPGHDPIFLDSQPFTIEGVIVQRNIRREIKHYTPYHPPEPTE